MRHLRRLDDYIAVVRAYEHVHADVRGQVEPVRGQQAFGAADGVPALAVVLLWIHGVMHGLKDGIIRVVSRGVVFEDRRSVPEDLEALVASLRADIRDYERVPLDHGAPNSDAHCRACCWEATGVPEPSMNVQVPRLDEVVLSRSQDRVGWSVHTVVCDEVWISKNCALAHDLWCVAYDLCNVVSTWLALARVNVLLAVAHSLKWSPLCVIGEHNSLAIWLTSTSPATSINGYIVKRCACPDSHGTW
mmetsp:Transcript_60568/g.177084  ORF Transcript_60568/g.177084 Transcript_60568/m.177084 type:complete len:247 (-) Transcript_60568:91-831(-)